MSDTVRFLTKNDTVSPPDSAGANGFPGPYTTGSTGSGTNFPVKVPFTDGVKWLWRVNLWALSSTWTMTGTSGTVYNFSGIPTLIAIGSISRELDLIRDTATNAFKGSNTTPPLGTQDASLGVLSDLTHAFAIISDDPTNNVADVWPQIICVANLTEINGATISQVSFSANSADLAIVTGSFTATIDGHNFTLFYDASTFPPSSYSVGTFDLTPSGFWAYAALADGTPVYNTSTGAQLQSPTN